MLLILPKPEFSNLINKFGIKIIITIIMLLITSMMAKGIWWCAKNQAALMEGNSPESHIKIIRYAALGRIILVTLLLIPIFLALYAKQFGGVPFAI